MYSLKIVKWMILLILHIQNLNRRKSIAYFYWLVWLMMFCVFIACFLCRLVYFDLNINCVCVWSVLFIYILFCCCCCCVGQFTMLNLGMFNIVYVDSIPLFQFFFIHRICKKFTIVVVVVFGRVVWVFIIIELKDT